MADTRRTEVHRYLRGLFNVGTVAGLSDGDLLDRFAGRRGESAELAFAALVERHGPMVLRVCRKVLQDSDDAADAFQATFLVLARKAGSIRRRDSLGAYLHGVALRVAHCDRTALARRRRHERTYAEKAATAYLARSPDDTGRILHEELGRLPERFRGVAVLCDLEGKTYVEAAGLLGCPPGTVMSRLAEARRRLRGRLTRRGLAPSAGALGAALAAESAAMGKVLPEALAESTIQAATRFAAGSKMSEAVVSASVTALTEGVLKTMFLTKLKSLAMLSLVGGAVATGAGVLAQTQPSAPAPAPASASAPAPPSTATPADPAVAPVAPIPPVPPEPPAPSRPMAPLGVVGNPAPPPNDRLQSLENKLDRLLNALESSSPKPRAFAEPPTQTLRPVPDRNSPALRVSPRPAGTVGASKAEGRLERAERRIEELADRLTRLERTLSLPAPPRLSEDAESPVLDLAPSPARRPSGSNPFRRTPDTTRPSDVPPGSESTLPSPTSRLSRSEVRSEPIPGDELEDPQFEPEGEDNTLLPPPRAINR